MRVVFFGSTKTSVQFLSKLTETEQIVSVITQPDKPARRGQKLHSTPVKIYAKENNIPVITPTSLTGRNFISELNDLKPDLGIVVSYGKIIPKDILLIFKYGCVNVHFSLLPKYRGAAPIQWAIINGEKMTGVTTFLIEEGLDTGNIFIQKQLVIDQTDNTITLEDKLIPLGITAMAETIELIKRAQPANQSDVCSLAKPQTGEPTLAPVLKKGNGIINWTQGITEINNLIRGLLPWPVAYTTIRNKTVRIFDSEPFDYDDSKYLDQEPGKIVNVEKKKGIIVKCGKGFLLIKKIQLEGKERISAWQFWQGARLNIGDKFQ